jgi:FKBP-type peptidyl-prolyl cis-trans isomerase SlyD
MAIKEGDFIRLSYTGKVGDNVFDTTSEDEATSAGIHSKNAIYGPVTICIGQKHVIVGLDEELVGKKVGAEATVTVSPEKAFGERDPKRIQSFPKNQFKEKPVRGM